MFLTLAFVFPGQGSQAVGMQADLAAAFPLVKETYAEASSVLGFDLWDLAQNGPADKLGETVNTQPAMLTAGVAAWRLWDSLGGPLPQCMSGHSLGEYTALVCAGSFDFAAAVGLVQRRGELMQNAVPAGQGAMAAILGMDDSDIVAICEGVSDAGVAQAANFNSPGQVVVAGDLGAVEKVIDLAKAGGARRAIMLPVSVPSHSSLMRPASTDLADVVSDTVIAQPRIDVLSAVDATPYKDPDDIRQRLAEQIFLPVRWVDTVRAMTDRGATSMVECGPGKVLTGLIKRIDREVFGVCIDTPDAFTKAIEGVSA